jgi:hypothetical protein
MTPFGSPDVPLEYGKGVRPPDVVELAQDGELLDGPRERRGRNGHDGVGIGQLNQ